jgi:nucleoside-diphosphate-sugar epimerase
MALAAEHASAFAAIAGTVRSPDKAAGLRRAGIAAHVWPGGEPEAATLAALAGADAILVTAAPGEAGDPVLADCRRALGQCGRLRQVIYLSTVGVYGDHGGAWIDETAPARPSNPRGRRRIEAEEAWTAFARERGIGLQCHRLAGIYGPGRSAIDDLRAGTARRIVKPGQVFNRIHVADIAGAIAAGLARPEVTGPINVCDNEPAPPQDVVAFAAALLGMPPPPETPFESAALSEMARSFYAENKRCRNTRLSGELGYGLRYPTYREGLRAVLAEG